MAARAIWWLLAISYPAWFALALFAWFEEPRIGIDASPGMGDEMVVSDVRPGSPAWDAGVRAEDTLIEIDGAGVTAQGWNTRRDRGSEFTVLRVLSSGESLMLSGRAPRPHFSLIANFWVISLVFASAGALVFWRAVRSKPILSLSLFFMIAAIAFAVAPATARSVVWAQLVDGPAVLWAAAFFFLFFYYFMQAQTERDPIDTLILPLVFVTVLAVTMLWILAVVAHPDGFEHARRLLLACTGLGFLGGVGILTWSYLRSGSSVNREQFRIMVVGLTAAIVPPTMLSFAPGAIGLGFVLRPEVAVISFALIPLAFGYAIMRHQLMGIRRLVHRGAAYALISLAVLLLYGALIATLGSVGGPAVSENAAVEFVLLAVLFVTVPSISWTRRLAFAAVDRALYREYVDYTELSRTLSVCAARATGMDDLASAVLGTMARELRLSFAAFLGLSDGKVLVRACMGDEPPHFVEAIESRKLVANAHSATLSRLTLPCPTGEAVLVSLPRGESDAWILCLGPKVTEEPFQREDIKLAQSIASHVATIVEKLELLKELKTKAVELTELNRRLVHTQEMERSRIASYLHDEPLQQITSLVWRYAGKGLPPELEQELQSIAEELRDFTARLHPRLLEDLGLVRALEWLCARASEESDGFGKPRSERSRTIPTGLEIGFDFYGIGRDDRLDPNIELALYRIAQEALTNCQRHSAAKSVYVSLHIAEGEVALAVEDDGVGFSPYRNGMPVVMEPTGSPQVDSTSPVVSLSNPSGRKLGLIGMRERAEQAGGLLTISGREPSGTRVAASIPISARHSTPLSTRAQKDFVQAG